MPCTLVDVWVWRRGGLWCTYCPVWWAQSILVTWAFLPALYISVASVGGGFGRLTETSTCSVHNISVEVVVCLFLVPFFFFQVAHGGNSTYTWLFFILAVGGAKKMDWSDLCNAWLGMLRSTRDVSGGLCILVCAFCVPSVFWRDFPCV